MKALWICAKARCFVESQSNKISGVNHLLERPMLFKLRLSIIAVLAILLAVHGSDVKAQAQPVFTSVYTDLSKDCKSAVDEKSVQEGQDVPLVCRGYGGHQLTIGFSAMNSHLNVETINSKSKQAEQMWEMDITIAYFDKGKIEWRLANGKPFAIIARAITRGLEPSDKTPQELVAKGLKGYETIRGSVPATAKDANAKARVLADSGYLKATKK
jgi:hypothetical protein